MTASVDSKVWWIFYSKYSVDIHDLKSNHICIFFMWSIDYNVYCLLRWSVKMSNIILLVAFFSCHSHVLPHDAMLARYMPWPCVRVRVRLSVRCVLQVGVMSKRQNEFSRVLALELPSTYPPLCYKEIRIPCPNSGTRQFCHGKSIMSSTKLVDGRICGSHLRRSRRVFVRRT